MKSPLLFPQCRLAIARAIYQNSSILVMDEATSALDSRSELLVRQAVERVMKNHTVRTLASMNLFCTLPPLLGFLVFEFHYAMFFL